MDEITRAANRRKWECEYLRLLSGIGDDPKLRVRAHLKYLDEYFLRWLGFCRLEFADPMELIDNGLFFMVEAASVVTDADIARLPDAASQTTKEAWQAYRDCLTSLRDDTRTMKSEAEKCYAKLKAFRGCYERKF